jgi:hypothetical protein
MWNFLISGLTLGCTLVLYDGSPLKEPSFLWNLVDRIGITVFGTSAKYISELSVTHACESNVDSTADKHFRKCIDPVSITLSKHSKTFIPLVRPWHLTYSSMCTNTLTPMCCSGRSQVCESGHPTSVQVMKCC